ncbi:MAG: hypothetical protein AAF658_13470 [Myxococcota bacterium]
MEDRLFITQTKLEEWIEEGEVLFEGETLTIFQQNTSYKLEAAVKILSVLDGSDSQSWIGKILTGDEIVSAGGEHYRDSVIMGETAYQCEEGFVGLTQAPAELRGRTTISDEPRPKDSDSDMLADFLLKHL